VVTGATNREIAATLVIAEGTVRNHLTNILDKLEVSDRTQAAVKAKTLGLV
jgi:DNA-binding NarL/FixJ family response regulator